MKFKIDENLPTEVKDDLVAQGHGAQTVPDEGMTGNEDPVILQRAGAEIRVVLTMDKGIADIRVYPPSQFAGLILVRANRTGRTYITDLVRQYLPSILSADIRGRLLIVSESEIRIP